MSFGAVPITEKEALEVATHAATAVGPTVFNALSVAAADASRALFSLEMPYPRHRYAYPLVTRGRLYEILDKTGLPEGWSLAYESTRMGKLCLRSEEMELRLLKERQTYPGGIPPAGRNRARRQWYAQPSLFDMPDAPLKRNLLLLWDYVDTDDLSAGISLRIVMTEGPGAYPNRVPYVASLPIDADLLDSDIRNVAFAGADEAEDFFANIDEGQAYGSAGA